VSIEIDAQGFCLTGESTSLCPPKDLLRLKSRLVNDLTSSWQGRPDAMNGREMVELVPVGARHDCPKSENAHPLAAALKPSKSYNPFKTGNLRADFSFGNYCKNCRGEAPLPGALHMAFRGMLRINWSTTQSLSSPFLSRLLQPQCGHRRRACSEY
jgi:hypothetical protein